MTRSNGTAVPWRLVGLFVRALSKQGSDLVGMGEPKYSTYPEFIVKAGSAGGSEIGREADQLLLVRRAMRLSCALNLVK